MDASTLDQGTPARIASRFLPPGWHDGTVVRASTTKGTCTGVSLTKKEARVAGGVVMLEAIDSIQVQVRETVSLPDGNRVVPTNAGQWIRGDVKELAKKYPSCPPASPR
jgi:nicotinate-nucleotide pyrophosphorylase